MRAIITPWRSISRMKETASARRSRKPKPICMRTRIKCGWLVGHANGHHTLWRHAELVFEQNTVLFVGERFDGAIDREIDAREKLVAPAVLAGGGLARHPRLSRAGVCQRPLGRSRRRQARARAGRARRRAQICSSP